jgi:hypothetical protein
MRHVFAYPTVTEIRRGAGNDASGLEARKLPPASPEAPSPVYALEPSERDADPSGTAAAYSVT